MRTAFVLTGGGSLGAVQVGMLRSLLQHAIVPDLVVGASVGAINAAYFAGTPTAQGIDRLASLWLAVSRRSIFPLSPTRGLLGLVARSNGFVDPMRLRRFITRHLRYESLEDAALPCIVVATDLTTGHEAAFSAGPTIDLLLASAAIPGIFPPVEIAGRVYVDGGVASNTPISAAIRAGAERILVLPTALTCAPRASPQGAMAVAIQSLNHMIGRQLARDFHRFGQAAELRMIPPLCSVPVSGYDFSRTCELIEAGHLTTTRWLVDGGLDRAIAAPALDTELSVARTPWASARASEGG